MFFTRLPQIKHLRVFGSDAYPLNLNSGKDKFEPRAVENCKMVGYGEKEGIYWIYDNRNHKLFRSRDVQFNEESILGKGNTARLSIDNEKIIEQPKLEIKTQPDDPEDNPPDLAEGQDGQQSEESDDDNKEENQNDENIPERTNRTKRNRNSTQKYTPGEYMTQNKINLMVFSTVLDTIDDEPMTFEEAVNSKSKEKWKEAIKSELDSLHENNTWTIGNLPPD